MAFAKGSILTADRLVAAAAVPRSPARSRQRRSVRAAPLREIFTSGVAFVPAIFPDEMPEQMSLFPGKPGPVSVLMPGAAGGRMPDAN